MHSSIKKQRFSAEALEAKKKREFSKIQDYRALQDDLLAKKRDKDYSPQALELTEKMLTVNPEFYTIWNYRREILIDIFKKLKNQTGDNFQDYQSKVGQILDKELAFLMLRLRNFPKVYWIWNHRKWCLSNWPIPPNSFSSDKAIQGYQEVVKVWNKELALVSKMLQVDARNYHGWEYRRFVVSKLKSALEKISPDKAKVDGDICQSEFDYTTAKITNNFSNFSAWHNRSKLIPQFLENESVDSRLAFLIKEIDLIKQAIFTDPEDQSPWIYHRWLLTSDSDIVDWVNNKHLLDKRLEILNKEISDIEELSQLEQDSKWCLEFLVYYYDMRSHLDANQPLHKDKIERTLDRLCEIDPMRINRYRYLQSKYLTA